MGGETYRPGGVPSTVLVIKQMFLTSEATLPPGGEAGRLQWSPGFLRPWGTLERAEKVGGRRQRLPVSCLFLSSCPSKGPSSQQEHWVSGLGFFRTSFISPAWPHSFSRGLSPNSKGPRLSTWEEQAASSQASPLLGAAGPRLLGSLLPTSVPNNTTLFPVTPQPKSHSCFLLTLLL